MAPTVPSRGRPTPGRSGNQAARALVSYFVGQGVGLVDSIPTCRQVVEAFMTGFADALDDMRQLTEGD